MLPPPVIILVEPQLVENIGMTARAMMNCALTELRIVSPRDPWPLSDIHRERMFAASSGADDILNAAKLFATVEEAIADLLKRGVAVVLCEANARVLAKMKKTGIVGDDTAAKYCDTLGAALT